MTEYPCLICGNQTDQEGPPYRCAYCGELVCAEHRLPENHGCAGDRLPDDETPEGKGPKPMELERNQTVGTTPDDIGNSSPDVTLTGGVEGTEQGGEDTEESPWWRRILPW